MFDFQEAFRVIKVDENNYVGAHKLLLPVPGARGVYGGHMVAQTLLVGIELAPGFIPELFHAYFVKPGKPKIPMSYRVTKLHEGNTITQRWIEAHQEGKVVFNAMIAFIKPGTRRKTEKIEFQQAPTRLYNEYKNIDDLNIVEHTDYIRSAYLNEFKDFKLCPEEYNQSALQRWITVWGGINQGGNPNSSKSSEETIKSNRKSFNDAKLNYVGLADLSDTAILTTMARVLHLDWNPTVDNPYQEYDEHRDALKQLMNTSLNMLHLFHYNAMSLDHHIYFHCDEWDSFDISKNWLACCYQWKVLLNNRALLRGYMYDDKGKVVATIIQEGLTYLTDGVFDKARL
ncbi:hypothetical protein HYPBUDRAFT_158641 [Hyphopichia burtonii NRRL Y-1933]|uniref:Thioesterase/thiol ester dehydrase-isomerase n=1 Tax=Hyphopichia burtonii NRRL Y-1933 TaxID=984485 RepID=A0A1E4RCV2_9ASCO|nr:hypothetical protein HYPBUDRAFT_158641 [Hyphopichia burtonii NRRL Y-1933]ODV65071.1 hypothetical protein HYPBUDRAFT_158641 [Hyphopichia burtonii NRRL Y-1933]